MIATFLLSTSVLVSAFVPPGTPAARAPALHAFDASAVHDVTSSIMLAAADNDEIAYGL